MARFNRCAGWLLAAATLWGSSALAQDAWTTEAREGSGAAEGPPPRMLERRDMLDEVQSAVSDWAAEAQEFISGQLEHDRIQTEWLLADRAAPAAKHATKEPETEEQGEAAAADSEQQDETPVARGDSSWLDAELGKLEERQNKKEQPATTAPVEKVDDEWERAAEKKRQERAAAIEKEAQRIQRELNEARRRQAEERAKAMGGSLDKEGNYVDPDLEGEP